MKTTPKEQAILKKIEGRVAMMDELMRGLVLDVMALSNHTKNRIAAHKAHLTMAKRKRTK